jgi:prepilin-type N-terminal cleavage/methylation domain-containing protein
MKGFTLIEVIISITICTALVGLGLLMSMETFRGTLYRSETATIVSLLEKARSRAMNNIEQSAWSVCYVDPAYLISRGAACSLATASETITANAAVALASDFIHTFPIITFTQLSGTTTGASLTVLQDTRTSVISTNHEGTVIW